MSVGIGIGGRIILHIEKTLPERLIQNSFYLMRLNVDIAKDLYNAARTIEILSAKIAEYKTKERFRDHGDKWIACEDDLPEPGAIVVVAADRIYDWETHGDGAIRAIGRRAFPRIEGQDPTWEFMRYYQDFRFRETSTKDIILPGDGYVTHWMPFPDFPDSYEREDE